MKLASIDLTDLDLFVHGDPHAAWKLMRAQAPVYWHERAPGPAFWSITRYEDALKVYHDPATYSSERGMALSFAHNLPPQAQTGFGQMLILTDPPRHTKMRQIINRRFTPRAIAPYHPHVRKIAADIIDRVAGAGRCDFVVDVAAKLPTAVICEMMGIPPADWELMFAIANMSIGSEDPEYQDGRSADETGRQAELEAFGYFSRLVEQRRQSPGEDLVSALVFGEIEGEKLTDMEVLFNCFLLIIGGQETTRNATSGGLLALLEHPGEHARLRRDPALLPIAIEEVLRWTSPITHLMRTARRDGELGGHRIRGGERVVVWNASANRDEGVFADPYRFDISRRPNDHLAFGHGEHFCIGANLARLELSVMVEELMRRLPDIELADEPERLRSNLVAGIKHMPVRFSAQGRAAPPPAAR